MEMRKKTYATLKEMRPHLAKLNEDFGCDENNPVVGLVCNMKSQNAYIKCIYKECKYEHWFSYTGQGAKDKTEPKNIHYSRSINKNHSVAAHKSGQQRDQGFL
jgi:hypothetical protein